MRPLADIAMALMGPRGSGRTYKMLQGARPDATVLCASHHHMRALKGMASDLGRTDLRFVVPDGDNLKGREGPVVADHYALERFLLEADDELRALRQRVADLEAAAVPLALEFQQGQMSDHHSIHRLMWEALLKALGTAAHLPDPPA